jgi:HTH-type transcriptional regulator/antitoxin HigA
MARALHEHLGIPAEVLLRERGVASSEPIAEMEWTRFPFKAMAKLGWIRKAPDSPGKAEKIIRDLIHRAGVSPLTCVALYRKNDHARANAKTDPYALKAWCWQVLATGNQIRARTIYRPGTVTPGFLRSIAMLSEPEDGPRRAKDFLAEHGVAMVTVRHLPKTHLDGAVLRLADGAPVIGLTLRYDRLDNFWFCLLHELSHLGRHMDTGNGDAFIDDLTLRGAEGDTRDPREAQADEWAEEALIPRAIWEASTARLTPTPMAVVNLARTLRVHPAIVAGRIRHEQRNYRMLSHFVGTHEVRRQLGTA